MPFDDSMLRRNRALQEMLSVARRIIADRRVTDAEAQFFRDWIDRHPDMLGVWPVSRIVGLLRNVLDDGTLSPAEERGLRSLLEEVAGSSEE